MVYEMRMKLLMPKAEVSIRSVEYASADEVELFYGHLKDVFIETNFLKEHNPRRLMQRVRRLFNRINLEKMEVSILRGMLSQIQKTIERTRQGKE